MMNTGAFMRPLKNWLSNGWVSTGIALVVLLAASWWLQPWQGVTAPEAQSAGELRVAGIVDGDAVYADDLVDKDIQEARGRLFELESAKLREIALEKLREKRPKEFAVPPLTVSDDEVKNLYAEANLEKRGTLKELTPQIRQYIEGQKRGELDRQQYAFAVSKGYVKPMLSPPAAFEVELANVKRPSAMGPADAPVQIFEFSDFECPFCNRANPVVKQVLEKYEGQVRLVYRHLPLVRIHPRAQELAEASECASEQGKFWAYHDYIFDNFGDLASLEADTIADAAGVRDAKRFAECRESGKFKARVAEDARVAESLGIGGTPTFLIGRLTKDGNVRGELLEGAQPMAAFERVIERLLARNHR
jgi:protein-disulfide isomerase